MEYRQQPQFRFISEWPWQYGCDLRERYLAVGSYLNSGSNPIQTLTEHWNGTAWGLVSSPNAGSGDNLFNSVTGVQGTDDAWAVGDTFYPSDVQEGLTEFYC